MSDQQGRWIHPGRHDKVGGFYRAGTILPAVTTVDLRPLFERSRRQYAVLCRVADRRNPLPQLQVRPVVVTSLN